MRPPDFWTTGGLLADLLAPAAAVYSSAVSLHRKLTQSVRAPVPVVCIGNLTAGGAGKTPVAIEVARRINSHGIKIHMLTRGYGGHLNGPIKVDPNTHTAYEVGDEALLLATTAPTWVSRDKPAGAQAAAEEGAQVIVMDDGFQNFSLVKDVSLLVIDGGYGFGNGRIMPAGPLREAPATGIARADAVIVIDDPVMRVSTLNPPYAQPWLTAQMVPNANTDALSGKTVVAFAGIGRPGKFFNMLRALGCHVVAEKGYADHHFYRADEIMQLVELAQDQDAQLVTTMKDLVRLPVEARSMVTPVTISVEFDDPAGLDGVLRPIMHAA